jgi:hypothetical protein
MSAVFDWSLLPKIKQPLSMGTDTPLTKFTEKQLAVDWVFGIISDLI